MIISQTSEYALRAVACIAVRDGNELVRAKDLSKEASIPQTYLSKILRKLVEAKILIAVKGHNGGFQLAKSAKKIKVIHVLEAVDPQINPRQCVFGWKVCNNKSPCILHNHWAKVRKTFDHWTTTTTLEDVKSEAKNSEWINNLVK